MRENARALPRTTARRRLGIAAMVVLTAGACAAAHANKPYASALIVLAVAVASVVAPFAAKRAQGEPDENERLAKAQRLVVALLHGDTAGALRSLEEGADPEGHPRAGGFGAPVLLARLQEMKSLEASLCLRGAEPIKRPDPVLHRPLVQLAKNEGLDSVAAKIELMLDTPPPVKQVQVVRRAVATRRFGSAR